MGDESLFEYMHFELVNYCINGFNEKKVRRVSFKINKNIILMLQENDNQVTKISNLEYVGFSTGYRLIEKLTREMPRFKDELDTVKFICTGNC